MNQSATYNACNQKCNTGGYNFVNNNCVVAIKDAQYKFVDYQFLGYKTLNACKANFITYGYSCTKANKCDYTKSNAQYKLANYDFVSYRAYTDCMNNCKTDPEITATSTDTTTTSTEPCNKNTNCDYKLGETIANCPTDCNGQNYLCGDDKCNNNESSLTCPQDCKAPTTYCGDKICNGNETYATCSSDCVAPPIKTYCGDKVCNGSETYATCSSDCPMPKDVIGNSVAEYIVRIQQTDGGIPDAYDNPYYNQDNDTGYALSGLYYAYLDTKNTKYLETIKKNLQWMAKLQDSDGCWSWSYQKNANGYYPVVNPYYQQNGITAIKSVDAIQSYFARNLWLLSLSNYDSQSVESLKPTAIKGIECLIKNNKADDGLFFSSLQFKGGKWQRFGMKYSAGQADVYLGLMSAYKLSGDQKYYDYAQTIKNNFDKYFFDSTLQRYYVGISDTNVPATGFYPMSQGYNAWVFRTNSNQAKLALQYLIKLQQSNGAIYSTERPEREAIFSAFLSLGESVLNLNSSAKSKANYYIKTLQMSSNNLGNGAIKMSPQYPYLYTNISGFAILATSQNINFDPFK
jgi:hypothetical protein